MELTGIITDLQFVVWRQGLSVYKVVSHTNVRFDNCGSVTDFRFSTRGYVVPLFF